MAKHGIEPEKSTKQNKELIEQVAEVIWMNTALIERFDNNIKKGSDINKVLSDFFGWFNAKSIDKCIRTVF